MSTHEAKAVSLRAAINERAERLRKEEAWLAGTPFSEVATRSIAHHTLRAIKAQIRDLETELSSLLQAGRPPKRRPGLNPGRPAP